MTKEQAFDYWITKYVDTFNQSFPVFMLQGTSDDDLIKIMKTAIDTGVPYDPEDEGPEVLY